MLSEDIISKVHQQIDVKNDPPLLITNATYLDSNHKEGKRIVVVTSYAVYIFKKHSKNIEMEAGDYFYNIDSIKQSRGMYRLKFFNSSFTFTKEEAKIIAELSVTCVFSIFTPSEVPKVKVPNVATKGCAPTPFNRFCAAAISTGSFPSDEVVNKFKKYVAKSPANFDLQKIENIEDYADAVIFAIKILPNINHVTIPYSRATCFWGSLADYIKDNQSVEWLTISNPPDGSEGFKYFCHICKESERELIKHIELKDCILQECYFNALIGAFSTNELRSITLNHCAFDFNEADVLLNIANIKTRSKIREVRFATTFFNGREKLLQAVSQLGVLCLRGCNIELSQIFEQILHLRCTEFDFSSNQCKEPLKGQVLFPHTVTKISINDIAWNADILKEVIKGATLCRAKIQLNLANAKIDDKDLRKIDNALLELRPGSIEGFSWNNNKLTTGIINFIQNDSIKYVSLAGVDLTNAGFLESLYTEYLDIHGTKNKLGDELPNVMRKLSRSGVKFVDISHNHCGEKNLDEVIKAIQNFPSLRCINIDDNKLTKPQLIKRFAITFKEDKKLFVYVPYSDISKTATDNSNFNASEMARLFHCPKTKRVGRGPAGDEWENIVKGMYAENDVAIKVDEIPAIEAPNSDYNHCEEDNDEFVAEEEPKDLWECDVIAPPANIIEKIQREVIETHSIAHIIDSIVKQK